MYLKSLVILLVCISVGYSKILPLPSYMKKCSPSAPDFDDCCLRSGIEAIPHLLKGDRKYNIPNLLPLVLPSISLDSGPNFSLDLINLHIYGLETGELKRLKFDLENKRLSGQLYTKQLELIGKYNVDGRILVIPVQGNGAINVTTVDCIIDYSVGYVLVEKDGEKYVKTTEGASDISLKRVYFNLTNLYNGNEELGASTNRVINEEWEQLVDTLKPVIAKTIVDILNSIINGVTLHVPYKEFFLN